MKDLTNQTQDLTAKFKNGLVVSCQAPPESSLCTPEIIAALALCAERNGAVGVRIDSPAHIRAVKKIVRVPVIGIYKIIEEASDVYITPTFAAAHQIAEAGADVIALDATLRARPGGETLETLVARIHAELKTPVMADVATIAEGANAARIGCDFVGTTLSGYTAETAHLDSAPDYALVADLARNLSVPVICEGRLRQPADVARAFAAGAQTVVVGNAITGIDWLVGEYVKATPKYLQTANTEK